MGIGIQARAMHSSISHFLKNDFWSLLKMMAAFSVPNELERIAAIG